MKHLIFYLLAFLFTTNVFAQKPDTTWFTNKWERTDKQHGHYYRVTIKDKTSGLYFIRDFHPNGKVQMQGTYLSFSPEIKHGDFTWWYTTGYKRREATYRNDTTMKYIDWDTEGKIVSQGELIPVETIEKGEKVSAIRLIEVKPEYPGGMPALSKFLSENIKYPAAAYRNKITGTVKVEFTITKNGDLIDARVISSVDPLLDKEALRVIKLLQGWTPGKQDGKNVNVRSSLPINFSL